MHSCSLEFLYLLLQGSDDAIKRSSNVGEVCYTTANHKSPLTTIGVCSCTLITTLAYCRTSSSLGAPLYSA
nr:hypothetical protein Iba_chr08dCG2720 [Ipomoea batatas]